MADPLREIFMPEPTAYFLLTQWGCVVDLDPQGAICAARPVSAVRPSVSITIEGDTAAFRHHDPAGHEEPLRVFPDGTLRAGPATRNHLTVEQSGTAIRIRHGGIYLSADRNGAIAAIMPRGLDWERFRLLDAAEYDRLASVLSERWYLPSRRMLTAFEPVAPDGHFRFAFGPLSFDVDDILAAVPTPGPKELLLPHAVWQLEKLILYKPLVYYCCFDREEGFRCLDIAIDALRRHGRHDGDIKVLSERPLHEAVRLPDTAGIEIIPYVAIDVVDYMSARFDIAQMPEFASYQPILYLDTDTIVRKPLTALFCAALHDRRTAVHVFAESHEPFEHDYWGRHLFHDDLSGPRPTYGFTTGIMLLQNAASVAESFRAIRDTIMRQASIFGKRDLLRCYDQPVANYVMHRFEAIDPTLLSGAVLNVHAAIAAAEDEAFAIHLADLTQTILHFAGGVGAYGWKLGAMQRYHAWADRPAIAPDTDTPATEPASPV